MRDKKIEDNPPGCNDWTPDATNLDEDWAWRTLDGLGREGAIRLLIANPSTLSEALQYSKGDCFMYYLGVFLDYLLSDEAQSNFAAAAGFMDLLISKYPQPDSLIGLKKTSLHEGARLIASRQDFYEADVDIWGDFHAICKQYLDR